MGWQLFSLPAYSDLFLAANSAALTNLFWYLSVALPFVKWRTRSFGHPVLGVLLHQVGHLKLPSNIFPAWDSIPSTLCISWCSFFLFIFQMPLPEEGRFGGNNPCFFPEYFIEKSQYYGKHWTMYWSDFFPNWSDFFPIFLLWNYLHFYMEEYFASL